MLSVYTQINPKNGRFTYYCNTTEQSIIIDGYTSTYLNATFFFICGLGAIDVCDIGTIVMHKIDLNIDDEYIARVFYIYFSTPTISSSPMIKIKTNVQCVSGYLLNDFKLGFFFINSAIL